MTEQTSESEPIIAVQASFHLTTPASPLDDIPEDKADKAFAPLSTCIDAPKALEATKSPALANTPQVIEVPQGSPQPTMLGAYGPWAARLFASRRPGYSFLDERWTDVSGWKNEARALFASLVLAPESGKPEVRLTAHRVADGLSIEELEWNLPFGPTTRAWFLKPQHTSGSSQTRLPGVLALHDHGGNKYFGKSKIADSGVAADRDTADDKDMRDDISMRDSRGSAAPLPGTAGAHPLIADYRKLYYGGRAWASELARRGYGVLVHDIFPFESRKILASDLPGFVVERMMLPPGGAQELTPGDLAPEKACTAFDVPPSEPAEAIERYNAFASAHESIIAKSLFCAGYSWPGLVLAEDRAALEYLASRPDIDPERLGCGGLSGGGQRTNYLASTDDRIRCSFTTGFMTNWADLALQTSFTHTWMIYVPGLARYMDYPDILAMRAPLPTLVQCARQDPLFTPAEVNRASRILGASWRKAGAPEAVRISTYDGAHRFDIEMQEEAFSWFDHWLRTD